MYDNCLCCFSYSDLTNSTLQRAVDAAHPNFECEKEICSPFSPGPVSNDETVAFLIINPTHFDQQTGTVTPDAFGELLRRDLSVLRKKHATKQILKRTKDTLVAWGGRKIPPELRTIDEVIVAEVSVLRTKADDRGRILAVYDTALEDNSAHASVFTVERCLVGGKAARKKIRAACFEAFDRVQKYSEFEESLPQ